jgi:exodeoxyribonuclease V beta subunit
MQRFDTLSRELNVFSTHFLEASAGTGKTFSIEHFVTRLLIESDDPLTIEEILVVTFTRAATRELKVRVRRNLTHTLHALRTQSVEFDYLQALCAHGKDAIERAIRRIEEALICFDQAQIFTVHSFCHQMLTQFAFEAKIGFNLAEPADGAHVRFIEEIVNDFLRAEAKLPDYSPAQIGAVLHSFRKQIGKLRSRIVNVLNRNKEIFPFPTFSSSHQQWEGKLQALPPIRQDLWLSDFQLLRGCYYDMKPPLVIEQAQLFGEILEKKTCSIKQFDTLIGDKEFFLEKMTAEKVMKSAQLPESHLLHYPGLVELLRRELLPIFKTASDPKQTLLRIARDCQNKSLPLLQHHQMQTPDALLNHMLASLQSPSFVAALRKKYRAVIIDEFQDTDPIQWEIFHQLFLNPSNEKKIVCLVGDPKQSIYAFRNADVYTYLSALQTIGEKNRAFLDTNFRSSFPLVEALNLLFQSKEGKGWIRLPKRGLSIEIPFVKAHAKPSQTTTLKDRGAVHFFIGEGSLSHLTKYWPTESMQQESFFPFIAQEILRLKKELSLEWEHFAVLVKDRYQARSLLEFFKKHQIPASLKRGGLLTDTPAFFAMRELLEAVCFPTDLKRLKKLFAGPLICWNAEMIQGDLEKPILQEAKASLLLLHDLFYQKGFACFFQEFLTSLHVSERILSQGELSLYSDLRQLAEILIEQELHHNISKIRLLNFLESLQEENPEEETRLKIRPQEEKASVTLMTTHMSKGLEFDTVFALGLASRHPPSEEVILKKADRDMIAPLDLTDPACQMALEESDAEKMRQLYVALTRAKNRVYIPLAINRGKISHLKPGHAAPSELFVAHLLNPSGADSYEQIETMNTTQVIDLLIKLQQQASITYSLINPQEMVFEEPQQNQAMPLFPPPFFTSPGNLEYLRSFSSMAQKSESHESIKSFEPSLFPSAHTLPLGAETGLIFHAIMEKILKERLHFPLQQQKIEQLISKEIASGPLEPWQSVLNELCSDLLQLSLTKKGESFSISDIPPEDMAQEMEFAYADSEGIVKGFADLFFEFRGKYYLLDWKTNFLGPETSDYRKENLVQAMQKNDYYLQASLYAEALKRYVKLFDKRPFDSCFGGAFYLFVRGKAVLHFIPKMI